MKDLFVSTLEVKNGELELIEYGGYKSDTRQVFRLVNLPSDAFVLKSDLIKGNHLHYSPMLKSNLSDVYNVSDYLVIIPSIKTFIAIELKYTKDNQLPEYEPQVKGAFLLASQLVSIDYFNQLRPGINIDNAKFNFMPLVVHHHTKQGINLNSSIDRNQKMKLKERPKYGMKVFISNNSHIDIEQFLREQRSVCDISFAHYQ